MSNSAAELDDLKGFGIMIPGGDKQISEVGKEVWLNVLASFPDQKDDELNNLWARSLFLNCISQSNQVAMGSNLLKSSVILPGDIRRKKQEAMITITYRLNLEHEIGRPLIADTYYVQVSARQYLSNMVQVIVT
jgi:hypothetical protein